MHRKFIHKSPQLHPLAKYVTEDATALMFNITVDKIERIECCVHMVYVHAAGVSRFVSYADYPPSLGAIAPDYFDVLRWHRRWRKKWHSKYAPNMWQKYYIYQLHESFSLNELFGWWKVVRLLKFVLSEDAWLKLSQAYQCEKSAWEN
ncbi:MAG: hypothetical protein HC908_14080 [Calothrix sp. SM1_7_51]|nr:hypothetical protein [Calothrix sp. SM1_7_51]